MKKEKGVPYMGVSEGQGHDIPDKKRMDAPWFSRPDPLYFPGYILPAEVLPVSMLGGNTISVGSPLEQKTRRGDMTSENTL